MFDVLYGQQLSFNARTRETRAPYRSQVGLNETKLVQEVERYQLDIVGLTSTHSAGFGTKLLKKGWTLFFSGVAQGERCREWG